MSEVDRELVVAALRVFAARGVKAIKVSAAAPIGSDWPLRKRWAQMMAGRIAQANRLARRLETAGL